VTYNSDLLDRLLENMKVQWTVDAQKKASITWEYRYNQLIEAFNGLNTANAFNPVQTPQAVWDYSYAAWAPWGYPEMQAVFAAEEETVGLLADWPIPPVT